MEFIGSQWQEDHVFSKSETLLRWQHAGTDKRDLDFVVAVDGEEIIGILGFIHSARFDPQLDHDSVLWLALWKTRAGAPVGTGVSLLLFLQHRVSHDAIAVIGINSWVSKLYESLGFQVFGLQHSYVLNPSLEKYSIAHIPKGGPTSEAISSSSSAPHLNRLDQQSLRKLEPFLRDAWGDIGIPRKTATYFANRYLEHPIYNYDLLSIKRDGEATGLIVVRQVEALGARFIRMVDGFFPPRALHKIGEAIQGLLMELDAEGADFYHYGLDPGALSESGLLTVRHGDGTVIPGHFEPFKRANTPLYAAFKSKMGKNFICFKGDGDQDRPNRLGQI